MKTCLVALCLLFSSLTYANEKADLAAEAYSHRDYNVVGTQKVQEAIKLYGEAISEEADADMKLIYTNALSTCHYFLGTALVKKDEKKAAYQEAMSVADSVMTTLGVSADSAHELDQNQINSLLNQLNDTQELVLAEAFYSKGVSLAQWGNLNGIASSIGRLPEVLGLMERVEMMGYESIQEYGPWRTIGRVNFLLPKLFGGDLEKSEDFLKRATQNSLAQGQRYSANGYNNLYFAEVLYKRGRETQAKRLLDMFINADFTTFTEGKEPENREALRKAQELADDWN